MIEVNTQTLVFLQSLALGFALGLLYDVFRILRLAVHHSSAIIFLEDVSYFAVCAVVTFLFALSAVNGHIRVFLVLGELLGATIYYFSLGALVMALSKVIIRFFKALFRLLYRIFLHPFVLLFRWIARLLGKWSGRLEIKAKKVRTKAKYSLKRRGVLVYNLFHSHVAANRTKKTKGGMSHAKSRVKSGKRKQGSAA